MILLVEFARVTRDMSSPEELLRAEIEFWREMIADQRSRLSATALERMHQALQLAERKWRLLASASFTRDVDRGSRVDSKHDTERTH